MRPDDISYYARRAEEEIELAAEAPMPAVVAAHYRLSELYLERLSQLAGAAMIDDGQGASRRRKSRYSGHA